MADEMVFVQMSKRYMEMKPGSVHSVYPLVAERFEASGYAKRLREDEARKILGDQGEEPKADKGGKASDSGNKATATKAAKAKDGADK